MLNWRHYQCNDNILGLKGKVFIGVAQIVFTNAFILQLCDGVRLFIIYGSGVISHTWQWRISNRRQLIV